MFRFDRILKLGILAVLVSVVAVLAGSARASTLIDIDEYLYVGNDTFDFHSGVVDWYLGNGKYNALVWGTLTLNHANGSCARMRLEYFHDGASIAVKYGGAVCAPDGGEHNYSVS